MARLVQAPADLPQLQFRCGIREHVRQPMRPQPSVFRALEQVLIAEQSGPESEVEGGNQITACIRSRERPEQARSSVDAEKLLLGLVDIKPAELMQMRRVRVKPAVDVMHPVVRTGVLAEVVDPVSQHNLEEVQ